MCVPTEGHTCRCAHRAVSWEQPALRPHSGSTWAGLLCQWAGSQQPQPCPRQESGFPGHTQESPTGQFCADAITAPNKCNSQGCLVCGLGHLQPKRRRRGAEDGSRPHHSPEADSRLPPAEPDQGTCPKVKQEAPSIRRQLEAGTLGDAWPNRLKDAHELTALHWAMDWPHLTSLCLESSNGTSL